MNLKNKIVLVTGANRGIGAALVRALLEAGVKKVYATARSTESLKGIAQLDTGGVVPLYLDVTEATSVENLGREAKDVQILINNAGILLRRNAKDRFRRLGKSNAFRSMGQPQSFQSGPDARFVEVENS